MSAQLPPPGWYPDTERPGGERYWDGQVWTEHRRPAPAAFAAPTPNAAAGAKPDPWLWQSIVATLLCCLPFGIAGIVFAAQSTSAWDNGRPDEARQKAAKAKQFTLISVGVGVVAAVAWFVFMLVVVGFGSVETNF